MEFSLFADPIDSYAEEQNDTLNADLFNNDPSFNFEDLLNTPLSELQTNSDLSSPFSSPPHADQYVFTTPEAMDLTASFSENEFFIKVKEEETAAPVKSFITQLPTPAGKPQLVGKKRGRPKKVPKEHESTDISAVLLAEEELLKLDSAQYETHIGALKTLRPLTFAEEECIKAQRRRIKNRESAHISRERKRQATDDLSSHITMLEEENKSLKTQLNAVTAENEVLREQLQKYIKTPKTNNPNNSGVRRPTKRAATAATVLVVLFCFGLFFQQGKEENNIQALNQHTTRRILNTEEMISLNINNTEEGNCTKPDPKSVVDDIKYNNNNQISSWVPEDNNNSNSVISIDKNRVMSISGVESIRYSEDNNSFDKLWEYGLVNRPNTHYYGVRKIEQIFPPDRAENVSEEPYKMSFLIPSSSLPTNSHYNNNNHNDVVEILTQVIDISFLRNRVEQSSVDDTIISSSVPMVI